MKLVIAFLLAFCICECALVRVNASEAASTIDSNPPFWNSSSLSIGQFFSGTFDSWLKFHVPLSELTGGTVQSVKLFVYPCTISICNTTSKCNSTTLQLTVCSNNNWNDHTINSTNSPIGSCVLATSANFVSACNSATRDGAVGWDIDLNSFKSLLISGNGTITFRLFSSGVWNFFQHIRLNALDFPALQMMVDFPTQSQEVSQQETTPVLSNTIIGVIVAVGVVLLICVVLVVVLVILRRRRNNNNKNNVNLNVYAQRTVESDTPYNGISTSNIIQQIIPVPANPEYKPKTKITTPNKPRIYESLPVIMSNPGTAYQNTLSVDGENNLRNSELAVDANELKLEGKLGEGAFAEVFAATYRNKKVAVKYLKADLDISNNLASKYFIEFLNEAKLMSKIPPSPFVIELIGFTSSPFSIITTIADCGALRDYLSSPVELRVSDLMGFAKEICIGLNHLHSHRIVHRDLAARNVLLQSQPEKSQPKCILADLGLSRLIAADEQQQQTKSTKLPLKWCAPETLKSKHYGFASDMWSFGIVGIELYTRDLPFPKSKPSDVALAVATGSFTPTMSENILPQSIFEMYNKCFSTEPSQRPTASQFQKEFEKQL